GCELAWRNAVDATNPTREATLIGENRACRDFSQSGPPGAHENDGALQPHAHNITMRRHAHRLGEYASEVERAAPSDVGERANLDRLVKVRLDVVPDSQEHILAQRTS